MKIEFEIEITGPDAVQQAKRLDNAIKERNMRGGYTEVQKAPPQEGTLSVAEWLPLVMGATVSAAFVKGIFDLIKTMLENRVKREQIASTEKIEANKLQAAEQKFIFRIKNEDGMEEVYEFSNYDQDKVDEIISHLSKKE